MKIKKSIIKAIQNYYCNRSLQQIEGWDKQGDLNRISKEALGNGFVRFEAIAGTFWLTYKTKAGKLKVITTDEDLFPRFEPYSPASFIRGKTLFITI